MYVSIGCMYVSIGCMYVSIGCMYVSIGCLTIWRKYGIIFGKLRMFIFVTMEMEKLESYIAINVVTMSSV